MKSDFLALGFEEIPWWETASILILYGVDPKRIYIRGEVGFQFVGIGYTVRVWTTCIRRDVERHFRAGSLNAVVSRPVGKDAAWVVIIDEKNRAQYFAGRTFRTKNFVRTLLRRAWIAQYKVRHRVACSECDEPMVICTRRETGGNFWGCFCLRSHAKNKPVWAEWDSGLPARARKIAEAWRNERYRYNAKKRKEEKIDDVDSAGQIGA